MSSVTGHSFTFEAIDGAHLALASFAGNAVIVVNTASECGYTGQYADLQRLWRDWQRRGLVVLGVPSNDFGGQEPGSEAAILTFCREHYAVDFPLTRKQTVIGDNAHPFYHWIATELGEDAAPRWNFHKYLIAPDGTLVGAWPARIHPTHPEILETLAGILP